MTPDLVTRVRREVARSARRTRNGVRYATGSSRARVGMTPREVVWRRDKAELWRYHGGPVRFREPVVIVHSLVSRSYILDLRAGHSTVQYMVEQGLDVFMLDWGVPDELDADNTLETYVDEYLPRALAAVQRETRCSEVTLVGYCLGGILATLFAAGYEQAPVRNLILMATPVNMDAMGPMVAALKEGRLDAEDLVDETGNVPAGVLYSGFYMLAPTTTVAQYATLLDKLWDDEFVDAYSAMAQWTRDHVPFPGAAFRQIVDQLVRRNILMTGSIRLGDRRVELGRARGNVLNAIAERDAVVPPPACEPVGTLVGDPRRREELRLPGGHVTFGAGRHAQAHTMPRMSNWIKEHSGELSEPRER
jgi:polyhydroxyalkanoate synthase subunit PhaC